MAAIRIDNVRKIYAGGVEAVKGVDLKIADGEFIVLVGPSGCGKSTLLRMIAGLETITQGTVTIGDRMVNDVDPADRDIAMVFQNYALYPHMTVYGNLAYGLKNRGTAPDEIDRRVRAAARTLEIGDFLERRPRQLSGGQRQRVAMGRAIVRQPEAFLFDEPLSNLDAKLRVQMRVELRRLQRSLATTSLYVTHDQLEAMTLGDRIVVMNSGRIEQVGSPMEVYQRPASAFVAQFVGSPAMNILPISALNGALNAAAPARTGFLGIRPEDIRASNGENPGLAFQLTVDAIELVGAEAHIFGRMDNLEQELVLKTGTAELPSPGEKLSLCVEKGRLHFFELESGARLV